MSHNAEKFSCTKEGTWDAFVLNALENTQTPMKTLLTLKSYAQILMVNRLSNKKHVDQKTICLKHAKTKEPPAI